MNIVDRPIEELCSRITSGGTPSRAKPEYFCTPQEGHRWVKSKELLDCVITDTEEHITDQGLQKSSAKYLPEKTVLVAMYGANVGQLGWLRYPATVNQAICGLVADPLKADFRYLYYALLATREGLIAKAQGAAQQNLNQDSIKSFGIPTPDLPTQRRIASILSAYDDLIENNTRRITILEEMARRIYEEWFVRFRFPGHEQVKMVESELGLIPEGWDVTNLDSVSEYINRGLTPKYDDMAEGLVINQKCIRDQKLSYELARKQSKPIPAEKRIRYGDVVINSTGVGTLGRVAQVLDERANCTADTHVTIVRPGSRVKTHFFGMALLALEQYFEQQGVGATGQTELGRSRVAETVFVLPPYGLQEKFDELIAPMRGLVIKLATKNANLRATRDLLLPKLISGELDVSTLPEPEEAIAA